MAGGADVAAARAPTPATAAPTARSLDILAVDDDALVLVNTAAMLEDLGHEVTTAYSGKRGAGGAGEAWSASISSSPTRRCPA